ncbi:MAG: phospholipase/carboxylesterase [Dehalococcoidia bacterium]|nr:phospholipase/carboxylesterase [Dehalococcoidia bacterium]
MAIADSTSSAGAPVTVKSERGDIRAIFHHTAGNAAAAIFVGGFDGGFDGPADAIFAHLGTSLLEYGISSLRLDYRLHTSPGVVEEAVYDVINGVNYLKEVGVAKVALVGHSFGGAVVIDAAAQSPEVATVVALSSQTYGTRNVAKISPRPLLLIHGQDDQRLPPSCSEYIYARAQEPKELIILPGARHSLGQKREEVFRLIVGWLVDKIGFSGSQGKLLAKGETN